MHCFHFLAAFTIFFVVQGKENSKERIKSEEYKTEAEEREIESGKRETHTVKCE
jgi:hypothetical protein